MNKRYATFLFLFLFLFLSALMMGSAHAAQLALYDIESNLKQADSANATGLTASAIDATSATGTTTNFETLGNRIPYWDDSLVNGTVSAVPEPSAALLVLSSLVRHCSCAVRRA